MMTFSCLLGIAKKMKSEIPLDRRERRKKIIKRMIGPGDWLLTARRERCATQRRASRGAVSQGTRVRRVRPRAARLAVALERDEGRSERAANGRAPRPALSCAPSTAPMRAVR